jgi:hypothetical protein
LPPLLARDKHLAPQSAAEHAIFFNQSYVLRAVMESQIVVDRIFSLPTFFHQLDVTRWILPL